MTHRALGAIVLIACVAAGVHAEVPRLGFVGVVRDGVGGVEGLGGPIAMALSPDGAHAYVASAPDNTLTVLQRDPRTATLSFVEKKVNGVGGVTGIGGPAGPRAVDVSPDGRHVYVAGAADGGVAVFARDAGNGTLTFVEAQRDGIGGVEGLGGAWSVAISPDGRHLYVAGYADQAVAAFARDADTGRLAFIEARVNGIAGLTGLDDP